MRHIQGLVTDDDTCDVHAAMLKFDILILFLRHWLSYVYDVCPPGLNCHFIITKVKNNTFNSTLVTESLQLLQQ